MKIKDPRENLKRFIMGGATNSFSYNLYHLTPFKNAQSWMGKNTFPILFLNDDNMIGEH